MGIWKYSDDYKAYKRNNDGNNDVYRALLRRVEHMAISIIEWEGVPYKKMSRDIEYITYTNRIAAIDDYRGVPTVCPCWATSVNMYGEPVRVSVFLPDGGVRDRSVEDVVVIQDTQVPGYGRIDTVALWADRYTDAQTTIDTQVATQRTPIIMSGSDRNTLDKSRRMVVDLVDGVKAMALEEGVVGSIQALDLHAPWNVPDLVQWQQTCYKRMLEGIGVDASAWRKAERLVVDEQEADDESLALILQDMLDARLIAAERMAEVHGWTVTPKVITPVRVKSETDTDDGEQGGASDAAA